jgi:hypothetical protein
MHNSRNGTIPSYKKELVRFDFNLVFQKEVTKDFIDNDKGPLNMPKFFRKQVDHEILKKTDTIIIRH